METDIHERDCIGGHTLTAALPRPVVVMTDGPRQSSHPNEMKRGDENAKEGKRRSSRVEANIAR